MTTRFYAPADHIAGDWLHLPSEEAHHAVRVLRVQQGDEIEVVDGEGRWYGVRLEQVDKKNAAGTILARQQNVGEPTYHLTIGLALLKHRGRYETFLEKAVELGVSTIVPLVTERTERNAFRIARAEHILVAAMKQCGRSRLTTLTAPQPFADVLSAGAGLRLLAHEQTDVAESLRHRLATAPEAASIQLLVGPEGGFSEREVAQAQAAGWQTVSLGPRRLRAETAALAGAAGILLYHTL